MMLVAVGVLSVAASAIAMRESLGWWQAGIYAGCLLALGGLWWFRRRISDSERALRRIEQRIAEREDTLAQQRHALNAARESAAAQIDAQSSRLDGREEELARKLVAYHEWMEFPEPVDLSRAPQHDHELADLAAKDRRMMKLLDKEVEVLFERIRNNEYSVDGTFQATIARDHAYDLILRVAHIYQGDAESPLLETSLARVLRAASRVCLHFLIVMDQLPLNVKDYSLNNLYAYVRHAVKAYGVYKRAEPFLPYVNTAVQLGRYAMGANPISLGAWWFAGTLGQKGAKKAATSIVNRHALALLNDLVRVIGFEVASVYGGQFRHRDANWIYATEVTDLVSQLEQTHETLSLALQEIGELQLRTEYDRVFLYRLLAAHKSANPARYRADVCLTAQERHVVATRLESFARRLAFDPSPKRMQRWMADVEERLLVKVRFDPARPKVPRDQQRRDAIRSLASFAMQFQHREADDVLEAIGDLNLFLELPDELRQQVIRHLRDDPPYVFSPPDDIEPQSELAARYLSDLAVLAARTQENCDSAVLDAAAYLRADAAGVRKLLDEQYLTRLREWMRPTALPQDFTAAAAREVVRLAQSHPKIQRIYGNVAIEHPRPQPPFDLDDDANWLIAFDDELVAINVRDEPQVLWRGGEDVAAQRVLGLFGGRCRLRGGAWLAGAEVEQPVLCITGPKLTSYDAYFGPLMRFRESASSETASEAR